ncbi:MAG TPA: transposase, partial [Cytophagales bacterium]|nr:transposase [Cytophagales bacterium]
KNVEVYTSKYGKQKSFNDIEPYAKIIPALHAGSQWQIDGWDLPFYYKGDYKGKITSHLKLVLFTVRDSHSKKIVGYSIGENEDTQLILDGLQDAVKNTGFLPFEIVSDNHSFNRTNEAKFFKEAIDSIGITWTVDENPRRKAIAERYFRHLGEDHCKKYSGYIGQGIKTKEKSGRPSQEYLDQYTKAGTWLSKEEIKLIGIEVVKNFNETPLTALNGRSPNKVHDESEKPHIFKIEFEERLRLFLRKHKSKVTRGQINITRGNNKYEFQLNADQFSKLNGQEVIVRYEDLSTIYIFDNKDHCIGSVKQKVGIHGAIADQTEEDIKNLQKNKGRLNGIQAKAKNANEKLREQAEAISPDAYEVLNPLLVSKNVLNEVRQNFESKQRAAELGIDLELVEVGQKPETRIPKSLQPKEKNKSNPFYDRNHKVSVMDFKKGED